MHKITIKNLSKKHRGVFATADIKKGEVIEQCTVVVFRIKDKKHLDKTGVYDYYFKWGARDLPAIVLGWGSIYNHSYEPNADYNQNLKKRLMVFKAIRSIKKGEQIYTNYNGNPTDKSPIWFKVKQL